MREGGLLPKAVMLKEKQKQTTQPHSPDTPRAGQVCDGKYSLGQENPKSNSNTKGV